jgi:hypothetical protein
MNILALDLGKYKTVFCDYNSDNGEHEFGKVKTTPQTIHDLIVEKEPQIVVLEVCNIAGWVVDIARALGKEAETANTTHDAWRWKNVKKKNETNYPQYTYRAGKSERSDRLLNTGRSW